MKKYVLIIFLGISIVCQSQSDSVAYSLDYVFKEGIYLSENQFKKNAPLPTSSIVANVSPDRVDYLTAVTEQDSITFIGVSGLKNVIATNDIWGYCQNQIIHIRFKNKFERINSIGTLCRFTAIVPTTVTYMTPVYPGMGGGMPMTTTVNELKQYLLDVRSNTVMEYSLQNAETVLKTDTLLYDEFMKLGRRKRTKAMYAFIKRYNDRHPLFLTKE